MVSGDRGDTSNPSFQQCFPVFGNGAGFNFADFQRDRNEQCLGFEVFFVESVFQFLVHNAFVCGMHSRRVRGLACFEPEYKCHAVVRVRNPAEILLVPSGAGKSPCTDWSPGSDGVSVLGRIERDCRCPSGVMLS